MSSDPRTRAYVHTHREKGRAQTEIPQTPQAGKSLAHGLAAPEQSDRPPTRRAKNVTLRAAANALGT
jgi:hypothetical protein